MDVYADRDGRSKIFPSRREINTAYQICLSEKSATYFAGIYSFKWYKLVHAVFMGSLCILVYASLYGSLTPLSWRRPMAHPEGWDMGCLFWVLRQNRDVTFFPLCFVRYHVIVDRDIARIFTSVKLLFRIMFFFKLTANSVILIFARCNVWKFYLRMFHHS